MTYIVLPTAQDGTANAERSLLHADDAARAFADAAEADATGCWHVGDEEPVTVAEFFRVFADVLDAPEPYRILAWLARPLVGKDTVRMLTKSMPVHASARRSQGRWPLRSGISGRSLDYDR